MSKTKGRRQDDYTYMPDEIGKPMPIKEPIVSDTWLYQMQCKNCSWFVRRRIFPEIMTCLPPDPKLGRCRRRAPSQNGFAPIYEDDWCGDFKDNGQWMSKSPEDKVVGMKL